MYYFKHKTWRSIVRQYYFIFFVKKNYSIYFPLDIWVYIHKIVIKSQFSDQNQKLSPLGKFESLITFFIKKLLMVWSSFYTLSWRPMSTKDGIGANQNILSSSSKRTPRSMPYNCPTSPSRSLRPVLLPSSAIASTHRSPSPLSPHPLELSLSSSSSPLPTSPKQYYIVQ